jgi:hypothetical protein
MALGTLVDRAEVVLAKVQARRRQVEPGLLVKATTAAMAPLIPATPAAVVAVVLQQQAQTVQPPAVDQVVPVATESQAPSQV